MSLVPPHKKPVLGDKALELLMRDILEGLEDFALESIYHFPAGVVEIESITAAEPVVERKKNVVHVVPELSPANQKSDREDIVDYLIRREFNA